MSSVLYVSKDALEHMKEELTRMRTVDRPASAAAIAEAREKGDLKENAEYDAAKEAQGLLEGKISKLQETLNNSRILDNTSVDISKVSLLSKVKIKNKKNNATMEYQIVSENEANLKEGKISSDSPIGKALLGLKKGESVDVKTPGGMMAFEVIDISR